MRAWPLLLLFPSVLLAQVDPWDDDEWADETEVSRWNGFVEAGLGSRFSSDPLTESRNTLEELRLRVESEWRPGRVTLSFKGDAAIDGVESDLTGEIRDLSAAFTIGDSTDIRIGRQVQTWGTGDLLFLNDLFPKDFVSFFSGRDDEYLKAPGDAVRVTRFFAPVNVDFVWTPVFEPDEYLTGERFSFFFPPAGGNVAPKPPLSAGRPDKTLSNGEFALRLFKTVEGREYAAYAYRGYFKQPTALTPSLQPTFAPLTSVGASARQPLGRGLVNVEASYYWSRDDGDGGNPLLPNDQLRLLAGYEWEAKTNFTVGLQYYLEWTQDYETLIANSPFPELEPEEFRHLLTNRLTWRAGRDKHTISLFSFFSPSDSDFYLRPAYTYRHNDQWSVVAGGNLFGGDDSHTFFNQLRDASNIYLRVRFHY